MIEGRFWDAQPADLHAPIAAALRGDAIAIARLVEFDFTTGPVRLCDWAVPVKDGQNGYDWTPLPVSGSIEDIAGGPENWAPVRRYMMTIPLDIARRFGGINRPYPDLNDKRVYYKRDATMFLQIMDPGAGAHGEAVPLGVPVVMHRGRMDKISVLIRRAGIEHTLFVEGFLARKGIQGAGLMTPRDQKRRHPGDLFLDYVPAIVTQPAQWPDY